MRYLREYYTEEVDRIWVNQDEVQDQCRQFFYLYEPKSASKVVLSQDGPLLFQRLGLETEVEKLSSAQGDAPLRSQHRDRSGRGAGGHRRELGQGRRPSRGAERKTEGEGPRQPRRGDLEETVFAVNRDAAVEIARQLRLRDLGGIIIVDFIDMEQEKHRRQIEEVMRKALSRDKAKVKIFEISPLGIMQISRQRLRKAGPQFSRPACESCQGRGWHASPSSGALSALRKLEERLHGKKAGQSLAVSAPYPVANKLMNEFREHVIAMEKRYGGTVRLHALPTASGEPVVIVLGGGEGGQVREGRPAEREEAASRSMQPVPRRAQVRAPENTESREGNAETRSQENRETPADAGAGMAADAAGEPDDANRRIRRGLGPIRESGIRPAFRAGAGPRPCGGSRSRTRGGTIAILRRRDRRHPRSRSRNHGGRGRRDC